MKSFQKTIELLKQLIASKQNLASALVNKGEEASVNEPFNDLIEKASNYIPKTMIFVDEDGTETVGTIVSQEMIFDATVNDVREGKVFASDTGVKTGEKVIPSYNTTEAIRIISPGSSFNVPIYNSYLYDYTKFMAIICPFNTSLIDSVVAENTVIDDYVYPVLSSEAISKVLKNGSTKTIELGMINNSDSMYIIRYFTYKEIY